MHFSACPSPLHSCWGHVPKTVHVPDRGAAIATHADFCYQQVSFGKPASAGYRDPHVPRRAPPLTRSPQAAGGS